MAKCTLDLLLDRLPIPLTLNPLSGIPLTPLSLDDMPVYTPTPISSDDTGGDTLDPVNQGPTSGGGPTPPYQAGLVFSSQFFGEMLFGKNGRKVLSFQRLGSIYGKNFHPRFLSLTAGLREELEKKVEEADKWFSEAKGMRLVWHGSKDERAYFVEYLVKGMKALREAEALNDSFKYDRDVVYLWKVYRALKDFLNWESKGKERPKDLPTEGGVVAWKDRRGRREISGAVPEGLAGDLVYRPNEAALYPEGLTQGAVYNYYRDITPWLMPLLKGYPLIVVIKADQLIYRQRKDKATEEIVIDSFEDYEYWNTGRTVSFYYQNPDETNVIALEFRPDWEYPEAVLKETVVEAIERLYEGQQEGLETISLMANGDRGYILTLSFEKVEKGAVLKERVQGWIRNMIDPDESLILKEGSLECKVPKGGGQGFQGLKHSDEISWALRTLIPELREHGFNGDVQSVNVAVDDLPKGKLGKTDEQGNIFLSPKLFQEGMREILKDVLFHEIMHLKQRSNPGNEFRDVDEREDEVLDEERSRLKDMGLPKKQIEKRVTHRVPASVKTNLFSKVIGSIKGLFKKSDDAMNNRDWNSDTTNFPVNPNTEQQGEYAYPTKKDRQKGPAFWYPTGTPADFIASPASSIYILEYFHDQESDIVEVQLMWEEGDFDGDKKEDIIRALQADLKAKVDGLRDLREEDCSVFDPVDRSAEFYIVNAFKGENKQQEQEGEMFDVPFGDKTYKVSVTIVQGKPVTRFEDGHHPELKEEEVSAIYSIALRQYAEKTEGPAEEGLKAKKASLYGWVSPDGKFHDAPKAKGGHSPWILTHPEVIAEYNVPKGKVYENAPLDSYDFMLDNGWLRVMDEGIEVGTLNWIEKAAEFIQKNSEHFPEDITIDVFVGNNAHPVSVPKESILDQGANAIWRAFKTRTASINIQAMIYGWLDPKGNFFQIDNDVEMHMEWVKENKMDLERNYGIVFPTDVSWTYNLLLDRGWVRVAGGNFQVKNLEPSVIENLERFISSHRDEFWHTVWLDYQAGGNVSLELSLQGILERGLLEEIKSSRTMQKSRVASLALKADMNTVFKTKFLALVFLKKYVKEMEAEDQSLYHFFVTDLLEELSKDIANAEAMIRARVDRGGDFPKALEVIDQTKTSIESRNLEEIIVAINKLINFSHSSGSILEYFSTEGERQPQNVVIDSIINFTMLSESDDPYYLFMRWLPGDYKYMFKKYAQYEFVFGPQKAEWDKDIANLMEQMQSHADKEGVSNFLKYMQEQINNREVPRKRIITALGKALTEIGEAGKISNPTPPLG